LLGAIIGSYQIVQKLGEGGMGVVYLGQHALLGRRAAIKVLLPALSARPDIVTRFFNEARAVTSISDPGIVQVFDFGYHTDGSAYIVMEFLEGEALDRRLARLGRLPVPEALRLGRQIATSLAAAHARGIVHRDLKPENVFLVHDGEVASGERTKILDFGIAKLSDEQPGKAKTSTGALIGTPVYMSPEQCRGVGELDHRSDIYALGCVLFHLISGRPPFEGEGIGDIIAAHIREPSPSLSSRMPEIAPGVDALVQRCLAKAPADRPSSMVELAAGLGQLLSGDPGGPATSPPAHPGRPTSPAPYPSRPGTPAPPSGTPAPPAASAYPGWPVAPASTPPTPTTLGSSAGQRTPTAPPARSGAWVGWIAAMAVITAAGTGIAVVVTRDDAPAQRPRLDAGVAAIAIDAAAAVRPHDAAPLQAVPPVDAPADAPADALPVRRPHAPTRPRAHAGSRTPAPPGCDRAIDTDCDGIPDVR